MKKEERILTLHPDGKKGVHISYKKYETIRKFILKTLKARKQMTYQELNDLAISKLSESFDGSVPWYVVSVKLDLEARKVIERVPKTSPHEIKMV